MSIIPYHTHTFTLPTASNDDIAAGTPGKLVTADKLSSVGASGSASDLTTGTLPAARLPAPTASDLGGVKALAAVSHKFLTAIGTDGVPVAAQPALADISGADQIENTSDADKPISTATQTALGAKLAKASNLSDLADAAAARTNLGLGDAALKTAGSAAGNVALLDSGGKLDTAVLPPLALVTPHVVASQAAMLALTAEPGDVAVRSDVNETFMLAATPASTLANWVELLFPVPVSSVANLTGAITAAALKAALAISTSDVSGLGTAATTASTAYATAAQGSKADSAQQPATTLAGYGITDAEALGSEGINSQGASYTLVLTDAGKLVRLTGGSANTLTIPPNSSVAFPVGARIDVAQAGAGVTSIKGGTGVTLNGVSAGTGAMSQRYGAVCLIKVDTNTWEAYGAIGTVA